MGLRASAAAIFEVLCVRRDCCISSLTEEALGVDGPADAEAAADESDGCTEDGGLLNDALLRFLGMEMP